MQSYGDQGSLKALLLCWVRNPFGYFKIAGVVLVFVLILLSIAHMMSLKPSRLYAENGLIEWLSFVCWFLSLLICFLALSREYSRIDRIVFCWLCLIFFLAAARELDAQILLNPKYFGQFGVHYKTRWFLSPEVNIYLKLFWLSFFTILGGIIIYPLITQRKKIAKLIRIGDNVLGFFLLGTIGLAIGFIFDDTLRKTTLLNTDLRQAIEETAEFLGSACFLIGTGFLSWKPFSERTKVITIIADNENNILEAKTDIETSPALLSSPDSK
jgi:hypothetical protein